MSHNQKSISQEYLTQMQCINVNMMQGVANKSIKNPKPSLALAPPNSHTLNSLPLWHQAPKT